MTLHRITRSIDKSKIMYTFDLSSTRLKCHASGVVLQFFGNSLMIVS
jgi:hypothetical protein